MRDYTRPKQIYVTEIYEATSSIGHGFPGSESDDGHADVRLLELCRCRNSWSITDGKLRRDILEVLGVLDIVTLVVSGVEIGASCQVQVVSGKLDLWSLTRARHSMTDAFNLESCRAVNLQSCIWE